MTQHFIIVTPEEREREHYDLYRHYNVQGELLYVGIAGSEEYRRKDHKRTSKWFSEVDESKSKVERITGWTAVLKAEREAIQKENPKYNKAGRKK